MWPAAVYLFVYLIKSPCTCLKQPLDMDLHMHQCTGCLRQVHGLLIQVVFITGSTVH